MRRRTVVLVIDNTILLSGSSLQEIPWPTILPEHDIKRIHIYIPHSIRQLAEQYQKLKTPERCRTVLDYTRQLFTEIDRKNNRMQFTSKSSVTIRVSVSQNESASQEELTPLTSIQQVQAALVKELLQTGSRSKFYLVTQDSGLRDLADEQGVDVLLIDPGLLRTGLCGYNDLEVLRIQEGIKQHADPEPPVTICGNSARHRDHRLHLVHAIAPESHEIKQLIDAFQHRLPKEALFRSRDSLSTHPEIFYAISRETIQSILERSEEKTKDFIDRVYSNWLNDLQDWIDETIASITESIIYQPCVLSLQNRTEKPLHDLTVSLSVTDPFLLRAKGPPLREDIPDIPALPILTQRMCADIDHLAIDDYLTAMRYQHQYASFISPSCLQHTSVPAAAPDTAYIGSAQPQRLSYTCERLLPSSIMDITYFIAHTGSEPVTPLRITCTCIGDDPKTGISLQSDIPVIYSSERIFPILEKVIADRYPSAV